MRPAVPATDRARELERDDGLGDDRERGHGGHVAALDARRRGRPGPQVDARERLAQRRERLHRAAHEDRARRSTSRPRCRPRGWTGAAARRAAREDRVVDGGPRRAPRTRSRRRIRRRARPARPSARAASRAESFSSGRSWPPSPGGQPSATTSTMPPSVSPAAFAASIAPIACAACALGAERVERRTRPASPAPPRDPRRVAPDVDAADRANVAEDPDAERLEERRGDRPRRRPDGGLARARALDDVARVDEAAVERAREIGVPGPRRVDGRERRVRRVAVVDVERDRVAGRDAVADARPRTARDPPRCAAARCGRDPRWRAASRASTNAIDTGVPGRDPREDRRQARPVALARGLEDQFHRRQSYRARRAAAREAARRAVVRWSVPRAGAPMPDRPRRRLRRQRPPGVRRARACAIVSARLARTRARVPAAILCLYAALLSPCS